MKLHGIALAIALVTSINHASAEDKRKKAQNVVDRVRQPDPPQVSTTTKPSPVGQRITSTSKEPGYKPQQKSPESKKVVVPPPRK